MKKRLLSGTWAILLCLAVLILPGFSAFAAQSGANGSLIVSFRHEDKPIANAHFSVYRVADITEDGASLSGNFRRYPVEFPDSDDYTELTAFAVMLASYAERDQLTPAAVGDTNAYGSATIDGLTDGLYLLTGDPVRQGDTVYFPQPLLVAVPFTDFQGNANYEIPLDVKFEFARDSDDFIERHVLKIWKDTGFENDRPAKVTVQLLRDGEVFDEQELNAANNWRYTWTELDPTHNWTLLEKEILADYTVEVELQGLTFTVTNSYEEPPPPPPPTEPPPSLPQTGQLWWPVPALIGGGALVCLTGFLLLSVRRKKNG